MGGLPAPTARSVALVTAAPPRLLSQDGTASSPAACDTRSPTCGRPGACYCCTAPVPAAHTGSPTLASLIWHQERGPGPLCSRRAAPQEDRPGPDRALA